MLALPKQQNEITNNKRSPEMSRFISIVRSLLPESESPFETYYNSILLHSSAELAPSASEARREYAQRLKSLWHDRPLSF